MSLSLGLLKPDCIKRNLQEKVLTMIKFSNLKIVKIKTVQLKEQDIDIIWSSCKNEYFYNDMIKFSMSDKCIVFVVEGENAIERLNFLVGYHDPYRAEVGTIRNTFGTSKMENIIHSCLDKNAFEKEYSLFF